MTPTAIGLTPPLFLLNANSVAPKKKGRTETGCKNEVNKVRERDDECTPNLLLLHVFQVLRVQAIGSPRRPWGKWPNCCLDLSRKDRQGMQRVV